MFSTQRAELGCKEELSVTRIDTEKTEHTKLVLESQIIWRCIHLNVYICECPKVVLPAFLNPFRATKIHKYLHFLSF